LLIIYLFAAEHKQAIPKLPQCLGVITSPSGAAIRDVLTVLERRFPAIPILIYPTSVQGAQAPPEIISAIKLANKRQECDVLLLTRGGGSLEDLWAFNDEGVARAMFASLIPIVSAVGHEIDFSISDFVADQRAATPSAGAELLSPDRQEWLLMLARMRQRLSTTTTHFIQRLQQQLQHLQQRLQHPGRKLQDQAQRLDQLEARMSRAMQHQLQQSMSYLREYQAKLHRYHPQHKIDHITTQIALQKQNLIAEIKSRLQQWQQQVAVLSTSLDSISPLATLARGYAILTDAESNAIIDNSQQVQVGQQINAQLKQGGLLCDIIEIIS